MTSLADVINRPVTLQGVDVVIIPDLVGPVPVSEQHQYVELVHATNTCPSISVRESDIEEVRERHPELPVFGLWQVLVHSAVISLRSQLQVVKINELDGYYLHCDLGRAEFSGVYEAGFFAADSNFDLDEANEIEPALDDLTLPVQEAKLASELQTERKIKTQRSWRSLAIACIWLVILALGVDLAFQALYSREQKEIQNKAALLESLRSGLNQLKTSRLSEVPNDVEVIKKLAELWVVFPNIKSEQSSSFSAKQFNFRLEDNGTNPQEKLPWLKSLYKPEGYWQVTFQRSKRT